MSRSARARRGGAATSRVASYTDLPAHGEQASDARLEPPEGGAVVRMYRIGHGDCFLLAFAGEDRPVYVLIDCGYKPGSPGKIEPPTDPAEVVRNIKAATGNRIDVMVITHEHQDHLNAITKGNFEGLEIGEAWFAWTEDPSDELANRLRARFGDQLQALLGLRCKMAGEPMALDADTNAKRGLSMRRIDELLAFEIGGETDPDFSAPGLSIAGLAAGGGWTNKDSMFLVKERAAKANGVKYLRPHTPVQTLTGTKDVRVMVLGPPRQEALLDSLNPKGGEEFRFGVDGAAISPADAAGRSAPPFDHQYVQTLDEVFGNIRDQNSYTWFYKPALASSVSEGMTSGADDERAPTLEPLEVASNAPWRRIDEQWTEDAEQLALAMNDKTNNASLVLAFELGRGGKVLLFTADAQRGNWISWADGDWQDGDDKVTAQDLLGRTVLLKVGHHGSHNATLNGNRQDKHPNLAWMATGSSAAREFTAMITAVRAWAETQRGWDHPMAAIKDALLAKASGRVLQTDTPRETMRPTLGAGGTNLEWAAFEKHTRGTDLYFDVMITRQEGPQSGIVDASSGPSGSRRSRSGQ